jgi:hypothetical protein
MGITSFLEPSPLTIQILETFFFTYSILLLVASIYNAFKHIKGARKVTDVVVFNFSHAIYSMIVVANSVTIIFFLEIKPDDCKNLQTALLLKCPHLVVLSLTAALFFNHWYVRAFFSP